MPFIRFAIIVTLLQLSTLAFSQSTDAQYSWGVKNGNSSLWHNFQPDGRFSTPQAALEYAVSKNPDRILDNVRVCNAAGTCWRGRSRSPSQSFGYEADAYRDYGTTCPELHTFNPTNGHCEAPPQGPCESLEGTTQPFELQGQAPDNNFQLNPNGGYNGNLSASCMDSCFAQVKSVSNCNFWSDGKYACQGEAIFDGNECSTSGAEVPVEQQNQPLPEPIVKETLQPCKYVGDPNGGKTCTSIKEVDKEGKACGTFNGQSVCTSKPAAKDSKIIDTKITSVDNPDGTRTETKTDTATIVICKQLACTTTTTVNTTTTTIGTDGGVIDSESVCVGGSCNGNTEGGSGECVTDCDESDASGFSGPEFADAPGFGESIEGFIDGIQDANFIVAARNIDFPSGGTCSMPTVSTMLGTLDFNIICSLAPGILTPLQAIFLVFWGFVAIRVLLSA